MSEDISDMTKATIPNSNQLNADDLLGGPITVTVEKVKIYSRKEQPVEIFISGRKPWYPCKTMVRVLCKAWTKDGAVWVGRSVTLFCDPAVTFGGLAVGGIRISHLSHIQGEQTLILTMSQGAKKPYKVKPLVSTEARTAADLAKIRPLPTPVSDPLADALREIGATIEQADAWCAAVNKPPLSTADVNTRAKAANHFRNNPGLLVQKAASAGESE